MPGILPPAAVIGHDLLTVPWSRFDTMPVPVFGMPDSSSSADRNGRYRHQQLSSACPSCGRNFVDLDRLANAMAMAESEKNDVTVPAGGKYRHHHSRESVERYVDTNLISNNTNRSSVSNRTISTDRNELLHPHHSSNSDPALLFGKDVLESALEKKIEELFQQVVQRVADKAAKDLASQLAKSLALPTRSIDKKEAMRRKRPVPLRRTSTMPLEASNDASKSKFSITAQKSGKSPSKVKKKYFLKTPPKFRVDASDLLVLIMIFVFGCVVVPTVIGVLANFVNLDYLPIVPPLFSTFAERLDRHVDQLISAIFEAITTIYEAVIKLTHRFLT